ncbi:MAG: FAD-dependent oxidoreductase, partial [Acidimicrobiales bacterium]
DWFPSVGYDQDAGLAWGGGYVGEGVAAANLAGRTLADLVTDRATDRVDLPWVNHRSRRWEPEPLRWLEINSALQVMTLADITESRGHNQSQLARLMWKALR